MRDSKSLLGNLFGQPIGPIGPIGPIRFSHAVPRSRNGKPDGHRMQDIRRARKLRNVRRSRR